MSYYKHPTAIVDDNVTIGENTKIWHFCHVQSGAVIGKSCSLGQNVNISNNVHIGDGVKIQNNVSVYEGVTLEDYVFCGPSCVFTNDLTPRARYPKNHKYLPTIVRHDATLGANCTIVCGHEIGHHATIAAGAVVTSNVPPHALMAGIPAKRRGWVCECGQVLDESETDYYICPDCRRSYFLYSNILAEDRSKPRIRYVDGKEIIDDKIYYLETNALYSLINHLDDILDSGINAATSFYSLHEIIYGIKGDDKDYNRRRSILKKIQDNNFILYPYTLKECVAMAYGLDISKLSTTVEEKQSLWLRREEILASDTFEAYAEAMQRKYGIDVVSEKAEEDEYEKAVKEAISAQIDPMKAFSVDRGGAESDVENDENVHSVMLKGVLDSAGVSYDVNEIRERIKTCDCSALTAFLFGIQLYGTSKILNIDRKQVGVNDTADLMHLLYLRDRNYRIVSNDKLFVYSTNPDMRMSNDEFLELCLRSSKQSPSIRPIRHLFIIGNGFDLAHGYPTSYNNFRDYLTTRFPGSEEYDGVIPESTQMPDGAEVYDDDEIAGYISRILDDCSGGDWCNLEAYLGTPVINALMSDLDLLDLEDDSDKRLRNAVYNNEDLSTHMKRTFPRVKEFFCDWIMDYYEEFNYGLDKLVANQKSMDWRSDIDSVLKGGDGFLTLNYTMTLERVYGMDESVICHVHGKVGDDKENIFLGHGEDDGVGEAFEIMGAESNLDSLKEVLRKDTEEAWNKHLDFFDRIDDDLEDIHAYGFSFSDVDLFYLKRIAEKVDSSKVTVYINKYDDEKRNGTDRESQEFADKIHEVEKIGYTVKVDDRW